MFQQKTITIEVVVRGKEDNKFVDCSVTIEKLMEQINAVT